jgi:transposase
MHGGLAATYARTQPPYSLKQLTMRGLLGDHGLTISMSAEAFRRAIPALMRTSGDELASFCQTLLAKLLQRLRATAHLLCRKTAQTPGIGPITAIPLRPASGRLLGLVGRQYSSGGKPRQQCISRRGAPRASKTGQCENRPKR